MQETKQFLEQHGNKCEEVNLRICNFRIEYITCYKCYTRKREAAYAGRNDPCGIQAIGSWRLVVIVKFIQFIPGISLTYSFSQLPNSTQIHIPKLASKIGCALIVNLSQLNQKGQKFHVAYVFMGNCCCSADIDVKGLLLVLVLALLLMAICIPPPNDGSSMFIVAPDSLISIVATGYKVLSCRGFSSLCYNKLICVQDKYY